MSLVLDRLRHESRDQHAAMEQAFTMPRSLPELAGWSSRFLGFIEPLERAAQEALGREHPLVADRDKAGWLKQDLQDLGLSQHAIAEIPRRVPAADDHSLAYFVGALYVFEGSTLGGQMISRHLEQHLGLRDGRGYRYFRSYGDEVGARWREFRELIVRYASVAGEDEVVVAARNTFADLLAWTRAN